MAIAENTGSWTKKDVARLLFTFPPSSMMSDLSMSTFCFANNTVTPAEMDALAAGAVDRIGQARTAQSVANWRCSVVLPNTR